MLSLRARLFVIISAIVLVVLAFSILLLVMGKKSGAPAAQPGATGTPVNTNVIQNSNFEQVAPSLNAPTATTPPAVVPKSTPLEIEQNSVKQLARVFAERYQTYSTDNQFQNIKEVQDIVSPTLWKRLQAQMKALPSATFTGVTSVVMTMVLESWNPPVATVRLQMRHEITKDSGNSRTYDTLDVTLSKASGAWLIDSFSVTK